MGIVLVHKEPYLIDKHVIANLHINKGTLNNYLFLQVSM